MSTLRLLMRQELVVAARSRWTQLFAAAFACLAVAVAGAGYVLSGGYGVQDFARTSVSLVQLVLLLVPMTALVLGVLSITPERGSAELLFSQPISRSAILLGKLAGLFSALAGAQLIGFGAAGLVVFWQAGDEGLPVFVMLVAASFVLTAVFLGLAALIAVTSVNGRRVRGLALAILTWFLLVVLYDVAALGIASVLPSGTASRMLMGAVLLNPVDALRTATLLGIEGTGAFGAASASFLRFTGGPLGAALWLTASLLAWLTVPALLAVLRLRRVDI
jgi:Cu-processing system permease protein